MNLKFVYVVSFSMSDKEIDYARIRRFLHLDVPATPFGVQHVAGLHCSQCTHAHANVVYNCGHVGMVN